MKTSEKNLTKLFKIGILFFGISIFLWNCEKEEVFEQNIEVENIKESYSLNYVSAENIPEIISLFNTNDNSSSKNRSSKTSSKISIPFGTVSIKEALEVIDTLGNQNYSFNLIPKTPKPNSIFNLVISSSNDNKKILLVEYRMAPSFAQEYFNGTKTMAEFTGSVFTFPFIKETTDFAKSSNDTCVQNVDEVINCGQVNVNNGTAVDYSGVSFGGFGGGDTTTFTDIITYTGADGGGGGGVLALVQGP